MVLGSPKQRDLLPGVSHDQALGYALEVFHRVMPTIGALGVDLCLEPLAPSETIFLNTCAQATALIDQVNHPSDRAWFKNARFRVTLGISARTLIGPALERVYATPG